MEEKLKPCPFCGGKAEYHCEEHDWSDCGYLSTAKYYDAYVECENCGARTEIFDTKEEAISAWNKRS